MTGEPPICGLLGPAIVPSRTPCQEAALSGEAQRRLPMGGAAKGSPRIISASLFARPLSLPFSIVTRSQPAQETRRSWQSRKLSRMDDGSWEAHGSIWRRRCFSCRLGSVAPLQASNPTVSDHQRHEPARGHPPSLPWWRVRAHDHRAGPSWANGVRPGR